MTLRPSLLAAWLFLVIAGALPADEVCWRDSYGRGVGEIPGQCDFLKQEKDGLFCYPRCKKGYDGLSFVCWQRCPPGFRNDGAFCAKPKPYGRGAGFPWQLGDTPLSLDQARARCRKKHGECEKSGEIIYPKCKKGYHAVGCCICSPDCPPGMTDIGVSCAKKSYTRETIAPRCPKGMELDGLLCYPKCKPGYHGVGPVCWGECPSNLPVDCGMSCAKSTAECVAAVTDQVVSVLDVVGTVAITVGTLGTGTGFKVGASMAARGAKQAAKVGAKAASRAAARAALKKAAKSVKKFSRKELRKQLKAARDKALRRGNRDAKKFTDKDIEKVLDSLERAQLANDLGQAASEDVIDPLDIAAAVDPTGILAVVQAYNNPKCSTLAAQQAGGVPVIPFSMDPDPATGKIPYSPLAEAARLAKLPLKRFPDFRRDHVAAGFPLPPMDPRLAPPRGKHPGRKLLSENNCRTWLEDGYSIKGSKTWPKTQKEDFCGGVVDPIRLLKCYHYKYAQGYPASAAVAFCRNRQEPPPRKPRPKPTPRRPPPPPPLPTDGPLMIEDLLRRPALPPYYLPPRPGPHPGRNAFQQSKCQGFLAGHAGGEEGKRLTEAQRERVCANTLDATRTIGCYRYKVRHGTAPAAAVDFCRDPRTPAPPPPPITRPRPPPVNDHPEICRAELRSGRVSWGGGTRWQPKNIEALCAGARDAGVVLGCFRSHIEAGTTWRDAIKSCHQR